MILLSTIDYLWREHLYEMDQLKEGIGLRGYGQRDPLIEYKREGYSLFESTINNINSTTLKTLFKGISAVRFERAEREKQISSSRITVKHDELTVYDTETVQEQSPGRAPEKVKTFVRNGKKIGRNEPCPCGSGKKYKVCCGR